MVRSAYSRELELVLKWCREFLDPSRESPPSDLESIDHGELLKTIKKHRLSSLVPTRDPFWATAPDAANQIQQFNKKKRKEGLFQSTSLIELKKLFDKAGIDFIVMKGGLLSQRLYGDLTFRSSRDIDLLIKKEDLLKCHHLLEQNGFAQRAPGLKPSLKNIRTFEKLGNQIAYGTDTGIQLEIHWRLFKKKRTIPYSENEIWSSTTNAKILEKEFLMFDDRLLFQYLYIHGARHFYLSLFWLLDFASFCQGLHKDELKWHIEFAQKHDMDRYLFLSLELTHRLFDLDFGINYPKNPRLEKQLDLVDLHLRSRINRESTISYNLKSMAYHMSLKKSILFKLEHLELYSINDYEMLPLPKTLAGLYVILRPFLFALRYLSRWRK